MKPNSYTFNVDKWKFIVSTNVLRDHGNRN